MAQAQIEHVIAWRPVDLSLGPAGHGRPVHGVRGKKGSPESFFNKLLGDFPTFQDVLTAPDDFRLRVANVQHVDLEPCFTQTLLLKAELHDKTHVHYCSGGEIENLERADDEFVKRGSGCEIVVSVDDCAPPLYGFARIRGEQHDVRVIEAGQLIEFTLLPGVVEFADKPLDSLAHLERSL